MTANSWSFHEDEFRRPLRFAAAVRRHDEGPAPTAGVRRRRLLPRPGVALAEPAFLETVAIEFGVADGRRTTTCRCWSALRLLDLSRQLTHGPTDPIPAGRRGPRTPDVDPTLTVLDCCATTCADRHQGRLRRGRLRRLHRGARASWTATLRYPGGQRLHPFAADAGRRALFTVEDLQAPTARCIRCSRRWSTATARSAASARRAS